MSRKIKISGWEGIKHTLIIIVEPKKQKMERIQSRGKRNSLNVYFFRSRNNDTLAAMSTCNAYILVSKYHSQMKGTRKKQMIFKNRVRKI